MHRCLSFDVLLDYAHNAPAFSAIGEFVSRWHTRGRKICVFSMPGIRNSDKTARAAAAKLAPYFDAFIPFDQDNPKFRREGLSQILRSGLLDAGVAQERINPIEHESKAIDIALGSARAGDLVAIFPVGDVEAAWQHIVAYQPQPEQLQ